MEWGMEKVVVDGEVSVEKSVLKGTVQAPF
jgi:hypothetical protein